MKKEVEFTRAELEPLAEVLSKVFIQRRDLYARQLDDGRYVCIQRPLSPGHLVAHLKGDLTLGAYVLDPDSRARYIVFDADDETQLEKLSWMARRLDLQGAASYLEHSRRGGHLWLFFEELDFRGRSPGIRDRIGDHFRLGRDRALSQTKPAEGWPRFVGAPAIWGSPADRPALWFL